MIRMWHNSIRFLSFVFFLGELSTLKNVTASKDEHESECFEDGACNARESSADGDCSLYMAQSSIKNAGWGIYTAKDMKNGDILPHQDIGILFIDLERHWETVGRIHNLSLIEDLLSNYHWEFETLNGIQDLLKPGYGMLTNGHEGLKNIALDDCETAIAWGGRNTPEIGKQTDLYSCSGRLVTTGKGIPAGHELFLSYGDDWFLKRSKSLPPKLPLSKEYSTANAIAKLFYGFTKHNVSNVSDAELYDTFVNGIARLFMPKRLQNAVPFNFTDVLKIVELHQGSVAYLQVPDVIKTNSWLRENGFCLDTVSSKEIQNADSLPHLVATARRFVNKGSIVVTTPVIHLSRRHLEMIYTADDDKTFILWRGHQLFLNYCFGHPSSNVLLFPYSPSANLIQPASADGEFHRANIGIRWSNNMSHPEWLNLTASELIQLNKKSGLMMEFYALQDILPNDILYLDYGSEWYRSWHKHVNHWQKRIQYTTSDDHGDENYASAAIFNKKKNLFLNDDIPSWIQAKCFVDPIVFDTDDGEENIGETWKDWLPHPLLQRETYSENILLPYSVLCSVVDSYEVSNENPKSSTLSRVKMLHPKTNATYSIKGVPRDAIIFLDKAYIGNQYMREAFRHEIQLPDAMMPDSWKDRNLYHPDFPVTPQHPERSTKRDSEVCGLYMAESAIPFSGLGTYTAREIRNGDSIFSSDLVVQAEDPGVNSKLRRRIKKQAAKERSWLLRNYFWNPSNTFGEYEAEDVESIIPGLGMLANSHTGLVNAVINPPRQEVTLRRSTDPGAGAVTTYHSLYFTAQGDIEAGSELFVEYGDSWFEDRTSLGDLPLSHDFELADDVIKSMWKIKEVQSNENLANEVLSLILKVSGLRPRFHTAIPRNFKELKHAVSVGTASVSVPQRRRSIEWLEKNGICLDNIRPGTSTIEGAGKGAFATRRIQSNQIIAPLPVVHLRRHQMEVYGADDVDDPRSEIWFEGMQLLLNYVFGHRKTSLLFFPYAPVVNYINHNATKANVKLRWSSISNHNSSWLERSPADLTTEAHSGLIMEAVATREIEAGEEIFLDYGVEWENAWTKHVELWNRSETSMGYTSATELNERNEWIKTLDETSRESHPLYYSELADIFTTCFIPSRKKMVRVGLDEAEELQRYKWTYIDGLYESGNNRYPCVVTKRDDNETMVQEAYDRRHSIKPVILHYTATIEREDDDFIVENIPRHAIRFVDKKYRSDQFVRSSFRREIGLPDDMVPAAWRDIA